MPTLVTWSRVLTMEKMTISWPLRLNIILVSELSPNYYFIDHL